MDELVAGVVNDWPRKGLDLLGQLHTYLSQPALTGLGPMFMTGNEAVSKHGATDNIVCLHF